MEPAAVIFRFGPYELRPRGRELYKHGVKMQLRPQPFQVLRILIEHAGEVVTREELHKQLWPSDTFVDFEHGLNTSVKELRGVLGDSAAEPRFIQTLPRLGYRIIVPVDVSAPPYPSQPVHSNQSLFLLKEPKVCPARVGHGGSRPPVHHRSHRILAGLRNVASPSRWNGYRQVQTAACCPFLEILRPARAIFLGHFRPLAAH